MTTRFSSSGLRIQYQVPPTSPKDSISPPWPSQPCRQRPKIPAWDSRVPIVKRAKSPPASARKPPVANTRERIVVFIALLAQGHAAYLDCQAAVRQQPSYTAGGIHRLPEGGKLAKIGRFGLLRIKR